MHRLSVSTQPSFQNSAYSGQHGGSLPFSGVVADKQCTCPASRLMRERYPPTPPFHCGENEIQASLISSASVGATPTPATNFGSYGRQTDISWLRLSRKQDRLKPEVGAVPTPSAKSNTPNERKFHEIHCSLSKPVALPQELQAKSCHPNPANRKAGRRLPPGEKVWRETTINDRPVAQEQSLRLITGRSRSVTCRDDSFSR